MSDTELENYLALLSSMLRLSPSQRDEIGSELRDHLETRVESLCRAGQSKQEAVCNALEEFGDAAGLAMKFATVVQQQKRRWMMRFATFSIVGVFVLIVGAMAMWPKDARFGAPGGALAQDDANANQDKKKAEFNPFVTADERKNPFSGGDDPVSIARKARRQNPSRRVTLSPETVYRQQRQRIQDVERELDQLTQMDYVETELSDVFAEIRDRHKIQFVLAESAIDAGLGRDELVTFQFSKVRLRTALKMFLAKYDSTYTIVDGLVVIASEDDAPVRRSNLQLFGGPHGSTKTG